MKKIGQGSPQTFSWRLCATKRRPGAPKKQVIGQEPLSLEVILETAMYPVLSRQRILDLGS